MDQPITNPISGPIFDFTFTFGPEPDKNVERNLLLGIRVKMLNDEKESHIKRAVFLPMYYTVISLMVRKSIFFTVEFDIIWR